MEKLVKTIEKLKKTEIGKLVNLRINEFKEMRKSNESMFKELCFCILTANFNAERSIKIQEEINNGFITLPEDELIQKLSDLGHRYPAVRAKYIVQARIHKKTLKENIESFKNQKELREWIAMNVKGIGYKEGSHFLRNIGFDELAIIDFHIIDLLVRYDLVERPKTLTKNKYLEIEFVLENIAKKLNLKLSELDLYLWYIETGKLLK